MNTALWIVQVLLAALFLFAGGIKLVTPMEEMMKQMPIPLPGWFVISLESSRCSARSA